MRNGKQLVILAISFAAIVVGIYMTYFHKGQSKEDNPQITDLQFETGNQKMEQSETENPYDYSRQKLPEVENTSDSDLYNGGKENIGIYFVNTRLLDESSMPLEAQAIISSSVQKYLRHRGYGDVSELYVDDSSFIDGEEGITFQCFMDEYEERLQIKYQDGSLSYSIVESTEGERN